MRKRVRVKKLGRSRDPRRALIRSLTQSLLEHGQIETSEARAKAIRPYVARLIGLAGKNDVNSRRKFASLLGKGRESVNGLFSLAKKATGLRIVKIGLRRGDSSMRAKLELIKEEEKVVVKKKAKSE